MKNPQFGLWFEQKEENPDKGQFCCDNIHENALLEKLDRQRSLIKRMARVTLQKYKICPFCDKPAELQFELNDTWDYVTKCSCGARGKGCIDRKDENKDGIITEWDLFLKAKPKIITPKKDPFIVTLNNMLSTLGQISRGLHAKKTYPN